MAVDAGPGAVVLLHDRPGSAALGAEVAGIALVAVLTGPGIGLGGLQRALVHGVVRRVDVVDLVDVAAQRDRGGEAVVGHVDVADILAEGDDGLAVQAHQALFAGGVGGHEGHAAVIAGEVRVGVVLGQLAHGGAQHDDGSVQILDGGEGALVAGVVRAVDEIAGHIAVHVHIAESAVLHGADVAVAERAAADGDVVVLAGDDLREGAVHHAVLPEHLDAPEAVAQAGRAVVILPHMAQLVALQVQEHAAVQHQALVHFIRRQGAAGSEGELAGAVVYVVRLLVLVIGVILTGILGFLGVHGAVVEDALPLAVLHADVGAVGRGIPVCEVAAGQGPHLLSVQEEIGGIDAVEFLFARAPVGDGVILVVRPAGGEGDADLPARGDDLRIRVHRGHQGAAGAVDHAVPVQAVLRVGLRFEQAVVGGGHVGVRLGGEDLALGAHEGVEAGIAVPDSHAAVRPVEGEIGGLETVHGRFAEGRGAQAQAQGEDEAEELSFHVRLLPLLMFVGSSLQIILHRSRRCNIFVRAAPYIRASASFLLRFSTARGISASEWAPCSRMPPS